MTAGGPVDLEIRFRALHGRAPRAAGRRRWGDPGWRGRAQSPASVRSASALSVRSQVNSGSLRPKWPLAAVAR